MTFNLSKYDYYELIALHRALLESKFNNSPNDYDVAKSPIINKIYSDVLDSIMNYEFERNGQSGKDKWISWLEMDRTKREWDVSLNIIKREHSWSVWDYEEKSKFSLTVIYPFSISSELLKEFIDEANTFFDLA